VSTAAAARARAALARSLRESLAARGYLEVETPTLVPFAGQEPHLDVFETRFHPRWTGGKPRRLFLQTSPEYAMKRLLARPGFQRCFQIARAFRDCEVSRTHNPEFTLLEMYAAGDAALIMAHLEGIVSEAAAAVGRPLPAPFERVTCREAFLRHAGFDPFDEAALRGVARVPAGASWDDAFAQVLLEKVEPRLERPTFLTEYPASQAALAKLKRSDPRVAERFELFISGLELANGWSELNDAAEQRARLVAEREQRGRLGRATFGLDERFLEALPAMPDSGGVALGLDRLLMLLTGAGSIADVLLFPAADEYGRAEEA